MMHNFLFAQIRFYALLAVLVLGFSACGDDDGDGPNTTIINGLSLDGRYILLSATFETAIDLDGPGPAPASTDASLVLASGLFGTSTCNPNTIANTFVEFATGGNLNLVCVNATSNTTKIAGWSYNSTNGSILLSAVVVPNPNFNPSQPTGANCPSLIQNCPTISIPALVFGDVNLEEVGGETRLTVVVELPYDAALNTEATTLVLEKE
ncbi:MAG: hypothetical protein HC913_16565 [Microscillaceae bacterium]|nr:hypothetical protein [Microscillaceae bacterium]